MREMLLREWLAERAEKRRMEREGHLMRLAAINERLLERSDPRLAASLRAGRVLPPMAEVIGGSEEGDILRKIALEKALGSIR